MDTSEHMNISENKRKARTGELGNLLSVAIMATIGIGASLVIFFGLRYPLAG